MEKFKKWSLISNAKIINFSNYSINSSAIQQLVQSKYISNILDIDLNNSDVQDEALLCIVQSQYLQQL